MNDNEQAWSESPGNPHRKLSYGRFIATPQSIFRPIIGANWPSLTPQQAKLWTVVDNPKVSEKNLIAAINAMNRIHIRRAHLLGLDAPTKLDVSGIYRIGTDEMSEERRETERAWQSLPVEEQVRIYDAFDAARKRLNVWQGPRQSPCS